MTGSVIFAPLLPWWLIAVLAGMALCGVALALWRGLSGWALRGLAALAILAALTGPVYQQEDRRPLSDIVLLVVGHPAPDTQVPDLVRKPLDAFVHEPPAS